MIGCDNRNTNELLDSAENLQSEFPDSAISLLKRIDINDINSESQKARHAFLYTHITTLNSGFALSDSTINIAVSHYRKEGASWELLMSLLYQSNYFLNNRQYDKSMMCLLEAEELFTEYNDDFAKGFYYMNMGGLYQQYFNLSKSADAYHQAAKYFEKANVPSVWFTMACFFEGTIYASSATFYHKAIPLLEKAKEMASISDDRIVTLCQGMLFMLYVNTMQIDNASIIAESLHDKVIPNNLHTEIYGAMSYLYLYNHDKTNHLKYLDLAEKHTKNAADSAIFYNYKAQAALLDNDHKSAFDFTQKAHQLKDKTTLQRLETPLMTTHRDYLKRELENSKKLQKSERQRNIAIIISVILLAIAVISYLRHLNKKKQHKIDEYANCIIELQTALKNENSVASELIQSLYKNHFKILNGISDSFFNQSNDAKGQKYVYNEVKYLIEQFSKDKKTMQELENIVNRCCNNIMIKLREELPEWDETDYRQLCYHYAGFSGKLISILLGKSQANVYMRKSRLKDKILQSDIDHKSEFLEYLS